MLPALNEATVFAGILSGCLVNGLIPSLAALFLALKVPNPTKATFPSFLSPVVIPSIAASNARVASASYPYILKIALMLEKIKQKQAFFTQKCLFFIYNTIAIKLLLPLFTILVTVLLNL